MLYMVYDGRKMIDNTAFFSVMAPYMPRLLYTSSSPIPCSAFSAIALGGVPIGVPMPPRLAAMGMEMCIRDRT